MRPLRSFLLLLIFLACFTGLHYAFPLTRLFPPVNEFIPEKLIKSLSGEAVQEPRPLQSAPAVAPGNTHTVEQPDFVTPGSMHSADSAWLPVRFLDSLEHSKGQHRILYYGDSQIEGDRITSQLRETMQQHYGGSGPGLFQPVMAIMFTRTYMLNSSANWKRYNYLSFTSGEVTHNSLGPFMSVCRYLPEGVTAPVPEKAWVRIKPSNYADSSVSKYELLRLFYGNSNGNVNYTIKGDGVELLSGLLASGSGFNEVSCSLNYAEEILIEFSGRESPDIYGISLEGSKGVIIDNIPQRGSAGLEFTMVDRKNLEDGYKRLAPDLVILHYGLNVVKNVKSNYSFYQKGLERQLMLLKEILPKADIVVISLTDMAEKRGDSIKSYHNIPSIIAAQRAAAKGAGVGFYDLYDAMGGESSIIGWTERKNPFAQNDYVHLTNNGADTLAGIISGEVFRIGKPSNEQQAAIIPDYDSITAGRQSTVVSPVVSTSDEGGIETALSMIFRYNPNEPFIFSAAAFWLFMLFVLAGYSILYKKLVLRNGYLFLVSLFFYYKTGGLFLLLLILVTLIDYTSGLLIHRSRSSFLRRSFLLLSLISNLGILAWFKYSVFFVTSMNDLFGTNFVIYDFLAAFSNSHLGTSFNINTILLPVGVSFFTFQSLSYTFDVYKRKMEPVRNIVDFGFYVSFFPQLVAGPIVRASEFIPQLYTEFSLARREFSHALFLISKGLIKKIIISDFIAVNLIDRVFDAPAGFSGFENLMAIYGYGLQIYCDFSGYTDIAIGVALILGFRLPVNFNSPYKAAGIADFWRRWHISLSRWLKDYLYIPLGGNRKGKFRTYVNLMITMVLGGLWHGAALKFIVWGALHGIGLAFNRLWTSLFGDGITRNMAGRFLAVFITFHFVTFCWIFFRAPDFDSVFIMIRQIAENFSPGSYPSVLAAYSSVLLLIAAGYMIHFLPETVKESYRGLFIRIPLAAQLSVVMVIAVLLYQMSSTEVMPFIYFRF